MTIPDVNVRRQIQGMKAIILDIDADGVFRDAQAAGLDVHSIEDFRNQPHNYWRIEDLMHQYARRAVYFSALSGGTTGIGGLPMVVTLATVDIAHMALQLYRLCQRLSILNGFDPKNPLQRAAATQIYLSALGFDAVAQVTLKQQLQRAATIAGKEGVHSNSILRMIILVAEKIGVQLTSKQAAKVIPVVGGVFGAALNYTFAKQAAHRMCKMFHHEYFRTWQARQSRDG
jgi:hypothetical protein